MLYWYSVRPNRYWSKVMRGLQQDAMGRLCDAQLLCRVDRRGVEKSFEFLLLIAGKGFQHQIQAKCFKIFRVYV